MSTTESTSAAVTALDELIITAYSFTPAKSVRIEGQPSVNALKMRVCTIEWKHLTQ
jgi:hypothetical protein